MKRIKTGSAMWHVMGRGARRLEIFRDEDDNVRFLEGLRRSAQKWSVPIHAYVLMGNHYHLLATASTVDLGRLMKSVNQSYSRRYNQRYELSGHLLDGSYLAFPQVSTSWAVRTSIYIHRNPVAAGLVKRPQDYRWSSYRAYLGNGDLLVAPEPVLKALGGDARREYRAQVEGWVDAEWKLKSAPTADHVWEDQARSVLAGLQKSKALGDRDPRAVAAWLARRAGIPLRAIARALGYSDANYTNVVIYRTARRLRDDSRLVKTLDGMI